MLSIPEDLDELVVSDGIHALSGKATYIRRAARSMLSATSAGDAGSADCRGRAAAGVRVVKEDDEGIKARNGDVLEPSPSL